MASRSTTHADTLKALEGYDKRRALLASNAQAASRWIDTISLHERSRRLGCHYVAERAPDAKGLYLAQHRALTKRWLVTIALQMAVHQRGYRAIPGESRRLSSEIPSRLTRPDPEAGPPVYRRTETGFTLTDPGLDLGLSPEQPTVIEFPPPVEPWPWQRNEEP